jgi:hypothetical protein
MAIISHLSTMPDSRSQDLAPSVVLHQPYRSTQEDGVAGLQRACPSTHRDEFALFTFAGDYSIGLSLMQTGT